MPDHQMPPGSHGSPDPELAAILPAITGPAGQFRHRQHINLAFARGTALRHARSHRQDLHLDPSHRRVRAGPAEVPPHGLPRLGRDRRPPRRRGPGCADFDLFAGRNPALLDKRLLSRHYRSATLASGPARDGWVEPDLLPFPWSAQGTAG
jgi:hypothetical protein